MTGFWEIWYRMLTYVVYNHMTIKYYFIFEYKATLGSIYAYEYTRCSKCKNSSIHLELLTSLNSFDINMVQKRVLNNLFNRTKLPI